MYRKAAEPHLEDGGIYRMRWWAYFDDRQNRLRTVAGDSVSLLWTLGCTLFQMQWTFCEPTEGRSSDILVVQGREPQP